MLGGAAALAAAMVLGVPSASAASRTALFQQYYDNTDAVHGERLSKFTSRLLLRFSAALRRPYFSSTTTTCTPCMVRACGNGDLLLQPASFVDLSRLALTIELRQRTAIAW